MDVLSARQFLRGLDDVMSYCRVPFLRPRRFTPDAPEGGKFNIFNNINQ